MSGVPVGQRAVGLPWLCPSPSALLGLTADPPNGSLVASDPALVAHLFRFARPTPSSTDSILSSRVLSQPSLCTNAAVLLESTSASVEPIHDCLRGIHRLITAATDVAGRLAASSGRVPPDVASLVTRLVPLGWWALAFVEPGETTDLLRQGGYSSQVQRRQLGLDVASIGRRLADRWRLPRWVTATFGSVSLAPADAERLGAPAELFAIVQAAVAAVERRAQCAVLTGSEVDAEANPLCSVAEELLSSTPDEADSETSASVFGSRQLFIQLLRSTAKARQSSGAVWIVEAEDRCDRLTDSLSTLRSEFGERLRDAKLASLAEFAAGASHEINNPMAVISGHAQLLQASETDPSRCKQLEAIIRQTRRVHDLLKGTMQFARPPRPVIIPFRLASLVEDVLDRLKDDAVEKNVELRNNVPISPTRLGFGDPGQIRHALIHLVRNAIDAAPNGGWVDLGVESRDQSVVLHVDDNGPGPEKADIEHLFDPFFSGRAAGRGRGLGLAIAWRLAQINRATIQYRSDVGSATRFELTLPDANCQFGTPTFPVRQSA